MAIAGKRQGRGYASREAAMAAFRFVPDETDVPAAVVANLAHHAVVERGPGDWTFRFDRAVLSLEGDGAGDLRAALRRVRCPTLLMAGEASWVMDAEERAALAGALPGSRRIRSRSAARSVPSSTRSPACRRRTPGASVPPGKFAAQSRAVSRRLAALLLLAIASAIPRRRALPGAPIPPDLVLRISQAGH
jgi:hypothetical protein